MTVATGDLNVDWVWLVWDREKLAGYALVSMQDSFLIVHNLLLSSKIDAAEAVWRLERRLERLIEKAMRYTNYAS